jgi:O-methyltransferase involved in polyketide biosynthesis
VKKVCRQWLSKGDGQLVLFGSGYDTSVFRLNSKEIFSNWKVFEVDFSTVQRRKLHIINQNPQLLECTGELTDVTKSLVRSTVYSAISCDICDMESLRLCLEKAGVDFTAPTLLIAECVLTYIKATRYALVCFSCMCLYISLVACNKSD